MNSQTVRLYVTKKVDLLKLMGPLEDEYRRNGFQIRHFGNADVLGIRIAKNEIWRIPLGIQVDIRVIFEHRPQGFLMSIHVQGRKERTIVGALNALLALLFPPLIALVVTALGGAANVDNDIYRICRSIDELASQQDPAVQILTIPQEKELIG